MKGRGYASFLVLGHGKNKNGAFVKGQGGIQTQCSEDVTDFENCDFEWLGVLRSTSQLQVDLKIFSDVEIFFYKLLRHCPGPGECSARRFMVIRHEERKMAR